MRYRQLGNSGLTVSELGFGAWTIGSDWWGHIPDDEARGMLDRAFDLGVTFYDTADQYGEGRSERLIGEVFEGRRDRVVIASKFGYDFYAGHTRDGHSELPQNFDPVFVRFALEQSLRRLRTDYLDLWQIHNARMSTVQDEALWRMLEDVVREGKVRHVGVALGPAIGWLDEGIASMTERRIASLQIIYNMLEQDPGRELFPVAAERGVGLLVRVPHSSGLLEGHFTEDTVFPENDHRRHRPRGWLVNGLKKLQQLRFLLEGRDATIGQVALKYIYAQPTVSSVLPNLYDSAQIEEFAAASDVPDLTATEIARADGLYDANFGLEREVENALPPAS